jgi:hypothetical protein
VTSGKSGSVVSTDSRYRWLPWNSASAAAISLVIIALILRAPLFGSPVIWIDEQLYLLVGNRMLEGQLPFVDLWDRKPIGLFLIYAFASLFGDGVLAYQLLASLCAAATSLVIWRMARLFATASGAWWAAVIYQVYLSAFHCFGGQSPVFYDLPMAWAALRISRMAVDSSTARIFAPGCVIMLAAGSAIQIKYCAVFEGVAFGIALVALDLRANGLSGRLVANATGWVICALAPTALAGAYYAIIGHWHEFFYANFESILYRQVHKSWWAETAKSMISIAGPLIAAIAATFLARRRLGRELTMFFWLWIFFAVAGFFVIGPYSDHYRAPLLVPLLTLGAGALGGSAWTIINIALAVIPGLAMAVPRTLHNNVEGGTRAEVEHATSIIRSRLQGGCLFIYDGDAVLYRTTHSCLPTRFVLPQHLSGDEEVAAIGVNPSQEVRRVMETRPTVVLAFAETLTARHPNAAAQTFLPMLRESYSPTGYFNIGDRNYVVFQVNPISADQWHR